MNMNYFSLFSLKVHILTCTFIYIFCDRNDIIYIENHCVLCMSVHKQEKRPDVTSAYISTSYMSLSSLTFPDCTSKIQSESSIDWFRCAAWSKTYAYYMMLADHETFNAFNVYANALMAFLKSLAIQNV